MPDELNHELPEAPRWQGINHLALVTPDMDATVRFYAGVLGMRVVATTMAGPMRHYFFETSPQNTVAFFEIPGAETFDKGAGSPPPRPIPIQLDGEQPGTTPARFEVLPGVELTFRDAGHILGSASVWLRLSEGDLERRIVFSGDLGQYEVERLQPCFDLSRHGASPALERASSRP